MLSGPVITWRNRSTGMVAMNSRHQNRVQPPGGEMHRLGVAYVNSAQQCNINEPTDDRPVRQIRLNLRVMKPQCFHREPGDA